MNLKLSVCVIISKGMDDHLIVGFDWDPEYLALIFDEEFDDMSDLWSSELVTDREILSCVDKYSPVVEDISMDDSDLMHAVEAIEYE